MTGTGTKTDPYIVMNVDEFIEAASISFDIYIKLGADINMDGISNFQIKFSELDGDGHSIINMVTKMNTGGATSVWYIITDKSIKIKNVIFPSCLVNDYGSLMFLDPLSSCTLTFENCNISVRLFGPANTIYLFQRRGHNNTFTVLLQNTVVDIEYMNTDGAARSLLYSVPLSIKDSHINVNISLYSSLSENFINGTFENSYITGKITSPAISGNINNILYGTFYHTYAAINGAYHGRVHIMNGAFLDTCFYDKELYYGSEEPLQTPVGNIHGLTTAQCKDADYLNSIGFYVVPEE